MKFGLIANLKRTGAKDAIQAFIKWSNKTSNELILCDEVAKFIDGAQTSEPRSTIASKVEVLVSMGGDGTLLATARAVGDKGTPILGINLGSLGFLTQLTPQELIPALDDIVNDRHLIRDRMLLKAEIVGTQKIDQPYALNDVVIDNGPISRIIDISLRVNGEHIVTYKADGLVIATPTGSTAYSLAVGGPILHPEMQAIIAAPISSFSLSTRPMIFNPDDQIEVQISTEHEQAGITIDGQVMHQLHNTDTVRISRAEFTTKFIVFPNSSFYKVLRSKLHWGIPPTAH